MATEVGGSRSAPNATAEQVAIEQDAASRRAAADADDPRIAVAQLTSAVIRQQIAERYAAVLDVPEMDASVLDALGQDAAHQAAADRERGSALRERDLWRLAPHGDMIE